MTNEDYHKYDETNRLLAEFEGVETVVRHPRTQEWTDSRFDYHHSWGSLMSVLEKINTLGNFSPTCPIRRQIVSQFKGCHIFSSIGHVYRKCVEFIQWYNENKQQ